jgi:hypothetical protein
VENSGELEREWNDLKWRAMWAMGSEDPAVQAAGRMVFAILVGIEQDEETVYVGWNKDADPGVTRTQKLPGRRRTIAIGINRDRFGGYGRNARHELLAEEAGHAWYSLKFPEGLGSPEMGLNANNGFRVMSGCTPLLTAHGLHVMCR